MAQYGSWSLNEVLGRDKENREAKEAYDNKPTYSDPMAMFEGTDTDDFPMEGFWDAKKEATPEEGEPAKEVQKEYKDYVPTEEDRLLRKESEESGIPYTIDEEPRPDKEAPSTARQFAFGEAEAAMQSGEALTSGPIRSMKNYFIANEPYLAAAYGAKKTGKDDRESDYSFWSDVKDFYLGGAKFLGAQVIGLLQTEEQSKAMSRQMVVDLYGERWLDMTPDERREELDANAKTSLEKQFPDVYGTEYAHTVAAGAGNIYKSLQDPTTALGTAAQAGYKGVMAASGAFGLLESSTRQLSREGTVDPVDTAVETTVAALAGPIFMYAGRGIGAVGGKILNTTNAKLIARNANKIIDKYEDSFNRGIAQGTSEIMSRKAAMYAAGDIQPSVLATMYEQTGRVYKQPKNAKAAKKLFSPEETSSMWRTYTDNIVGAWDHVATPVSYQINKISPKIGLALREHDAKVHFRTLTYQARIAPWKDQFKTLTKSEQRDLANMLNDNSEEGLKDAFKFMWAKAEENPDKFKTFAIEYSNIRKLLKEAYDDHQAVGYKFKPIDYYFPSQLKNPKILNGVEIGVLDAKLKNAAAKKGSPLTEKEANKILQRTILSTPKKRSKGKVSGHLKARTRSGEMRDFLKPHYMDPAEALDSYFKNSAYTIERGAFFRGFGYKGKMDREVEDMPQRINGLLHSQRSKMTVTDRNKIDSMLHARFTSGEKSANRNLQRLKDLGYINTLTDVLSAVTQFGDQAFGLYKNGVITHTKAVYDTLFKQGVVREDIGLNDIMQEMMSDPGKISKSLDHFLTWSQFKRIDRFGKNVILNGSLRKARAMVSTPTGRRQFMAKYGKYFEEETPQLMRDLNGWEKGADMPANVRLFLWNELADVQPISLSELPPFYLEHPDARILYALKTFTIKQIAFMRKEIVDQYKAGNSKQATENLARFSTFWVLSGLGVDKYKSMMSGDPFTVEDSALESILKLIPFGSRYTAEAIIKDGGWETMLAFFLPAAPPGGGVYEAIVNQDISKALVDVPIVGKTLDKRRRNKERQAKAMKTPGYVDPRRPSMFRTGNINLKAGYQED